MSSYFQNEKIPLSPRLLDCGGGAAAGVFVYIQSLFAIEDGWFVYQQLRLMRYTRARL